MPREGTRSLFLSSKVSCPSSPSFHFPSPSSFRFSRPQSSFSESVTGRALDMAEPVIMKWNPETTPYARVTSLFYHNRGEAMHFIQTVYNLQKAMHFLLKHNSSIDKLSRAQRLMQIAMTRFQKEFYEILSMNRAQLDPESVSARSSLTSAGSSASDYDDDADDARVANEKLSRVEHASTLAMEDLRLIAECMISSGYAKECLEIYKVIRKSIVDEGIYRLGVERFSSSQIRKMDWQVVELRIQNWLNAVKTAVNTLFNGERILCDHVFASSNSIRESCFTEITKEGAMILFGFPENVAKNSKKSPDKIFRVLDMYTGISEQWLEIDTIFSFHSTIQIKSQALTSLIKLAEFARAALKDFESAVLKNSTKAPIPGGGGIHQLTIDAMSYLSILADYSNILSNIFSDSPPSEKHSLPQSYFELSQSDESPAPAITLKMAWIILVLLCKLNAKAKYYKDVSLAYLFLANNIQYVVVKVRTSNLEYILGDEWLKKHESMVKQFASNYQRFGWSHVIDCIPSDCTAAEGPEKVMEVFNKFNTMFNQAYRKQYACVVPDSELRDEIKSCIARKIVPSYQDFYNAHRPTMEREGIAAPLVRFTPEDLGHHLSDLFGNMESGGSSSFQSSPIHSQPSGSRLERR